MARWPRRAAIIIALTALIAGSSSCGGSGPSSSCNLGGVADEAAFSRVFASMALGDETGTARAVDADAGAIYGAGESVVVLYQATTSSDARFCVVVRDGSGAVAGEKTAAVPAGAGRVSLGAFGARSYVVRVGIGGTLARNLPFTVR